MRGTLTEEELYMGAKYAPKTFNYLTKKSYMVSIRIHGIVLSVYTKGALMNGDKYMDM